MPSREYLGSAVFRCDVTAKTGLGHLMRCMAMAEAIKKDFKVQFVVGKSKRTFTSFIKKSGFPVSTTVSRADLFIHDRYQTSARELRDYKQKTNLLIDFDDFGKKNNPADLIYNPHELSKDANRTPGLYGLKYLILRNGIQRYRKDGLSNNVRTVFVCFGGTDKNNLTELAIRLMRSSVSSHNKLKFKVVIGPMFKNVNSLKKLYEDDVEWIENSNMLWSHMKQSDLAIVSGGSTKYELAYIGVPIISIAQSEIEDYYSKQFSNVGLSVHLGYFKKIKFEQALKNVKRVFDKSELRSELVRKARSVVNGEGNNLVRKAIVRAYKEKVYA